MSGRQPLASWFFLAAATALTLFCGCAAVRNWALYLRFPRQPATIRMAAAGACIGQWVTLADARAHCGDAHVARDPVARRGLRTYLPLSDPLESHWIVAWYRGSVACASLTGQPIRGVLVPLDPRVASLLRSDSEGFAPASLPLGLCSYCGPGYSRLRGAVATLATLLALTWAVLSAAGLRQQRTTGELSGAGGTRQKEEEG